MSEMDFATWLAGTCSFECALCGERFVHSISFYTHLAAGHRTRPSDYAARHGSALVKRNTVECARCAETVDHEKGSLQKHFALRHPDVRLKDYYEEFVKPGRSQVSQAVDPGRDSDPKSGNATNLREQDGDQRPRQQRRSSLSSKKENSPTVHKKNTTPSKEFSILKKVSCDGNSRKCGVCGESVVGSIFEHIKTKHRKVKMGGGDKEVANKNTQEVRPTTTAPSEGMRSGISRDSDNPTSSSCNDSVPNPEPQAASYSAAGDMMFKCDTCGKIFPGFEAATSHVADVSHGTFSKIPSKMVPAGKLREFEDTAPPQTKGLSGNGDEAEASKVPKHDIIIDRLCMGDEVTVEEDCIIEDSPVVSEVQESTVSLLQEDPLIVEVPRRVVQVAKCPLSSKCPNLLPDERNITAHLVSTHQISDTRTLDILVAKIKTHFVEI